MLRVAVVILVIMLAYACVYSLMDVISPKIMTGSAFKALTGKELSSLDADCLKALLGTARRTGVFALTTTIAGFFVLFAGFQKAQKWAWWAMLIVGGIAWLWGLIENIVIGDNINSIMMAIGAVLLLLGVLLPVKEFFAGGAGATE